MKRYISDERIDAYFASRGMTRSQAEANLRRRYPKYSDEKIFEEIQIGPMIDELIPLLIRYCKENPEVFEAEDADGEDQ